MNLPRPITEYVASLFSEERRPAFLVADEDGVLCDFGGALAAHGLSGLAIGQPVAQQVFFLEGLLPLDGAPVFFPCMKTESGMVADVHLIKHTGRDYILFLGAAASEMHTQAVQQTVNDLSLRRERESRPSPRLRETLLAGLLATLDAVLFRRVSENTFECVSHVPSWAQRTWPGLATSSFRPGSQDDFLSNFLLDAEQFWTDRVPDGLRSGIWCEQGSADELFLEATAINADDERLLLIERPGAGYEERRGALQEARNRGLEISALNRRDVRLKEAHRDLESKVAERTAELRRVNQLLQWELGQRAKVEEQMRLLLQGVESTTEMIAVTDREGRLSFANRSFLANHGYEVGEMIGQRVDIIWPAVLADQMLDVVFAKNFDKEWSGGLFHRRKDGSEFPVSLTSSPVTDAAGNNSGVILVAQDVHEQRKTEAMLRSSEAQLRQSQKIEAIGKLAGGVAHDFNNLLTVILGYTDHLLTQPTMDAGSRPALQGIRNASSRAAKLTQQLLAFSRKQILQPRVLDLKQVVGDLDGLLRRLLGEDVALSTHSDEALGRIKADPSQMEQVLMNLVVNSREAMSAEGRLTLELSNVELDESYARVHLGVVPGSFVRLTVTDTGCGMDRETQARVFEPFFTTKSAGTGLGLSTVYGIVKQSGGSIWVYSEPGLGTTFKLYFPRVFDAEEKLLERAAPARKSGGTETILVVEDESQVRDLICKVLSSRGYTILSAVDPEEADRLEQTYSGNIDLLLTDMIMPGKSGAVLAQTLAQRRPNMKILFMSGYTDRTIADSPAWTEDSPFIQKPFSPADLAQKLRALLDQK